MAADEEKAEPGPGGPGPDAAGTLPEPGSHPRDDDCIDRSSSDGPGEAEKKPGLTADVEEEDLEDGQGGDEPQHVPARTRSRASSARSRALSIVPRSKRRGLFGRFALIPEVARPYDYSDKTKWAITTVVALTAAGGPLGSSIFYPALHELARDLNTTATMVNLTVAFYMLAMAIFPLWWSSFSETLGRRTIYLVSFAFFVVFSVLSAVSTSIGMLIAMRVLGGGASASVQAVGAGTIADVWQVERRGQAMAMFYLGPLAAPLLAPIIGGALAEGFGWRSTMWFMAIFGGAVLVMLFFGLPETLARREPPEGQPQPQPQLQLQPQPGQPGTPPLTRMSTRQSVADRTQRGAAFLRRAFVDPLSCLLYLRFPPVAITVCFASVTFGALFVVNVSTQSLFSRPPYGFSEIVVGLLYLPNSLGYVLASFAGGRWIDRIMAREARRAGRYDGRGRLVHLPEDRLRENAWLAASLYPAALVWYGWGVDRGAFWLVPALATFFFGLGTMLVFGASTTMLTEFMPRRSSAGVALNNFVRNILSCVGVVVAQPLLAAMGPGWLFTMLAIVTWLIGNLCIWSLRRNASAWRKSMDASLNKQG